MNENNKSQWKQEPDLFLECGVFSLAVHPVEEGTAWEWTVQFLGNTILSVSDAHYATPEEAQEKAIDWLILRLQLALSDLGSSPFPRFNTQREVEDISKST
jgi:hypothetical protein